MGHTNNSFNLAKNNKNDEFYTCYDDIQAELNHYEDKFRNKVVLCNCDDPFESNFCKFFLRNFNYLGLKRLICTSYNSSPFAGDEMDLWHQDVEIEDRHGFILDVTSIPMANSRGVSDQDIDSLLHNTDCVHALQGDGDFRSDECIEYLKQADIVVTNPPFSLFRQYINQLMEYGKKFLIIGNMNSITCKDIFTLFQNNSIWFGCTLNGTGQHWFKVPESCSIGKFKYENGDKYATIGNAIWYTNLEHPKRHEKIILFRKYYGNEDAYPTYDNYKAINVNKVVDIPCDYDGIIGVPITYMNRYCPEQFKVIGSDYDVKEGFLDEMKRSDWNGKFDRGYINGKRMYARILIQKI